MADFDSRPGVGLGGGESGSGTAVGGGGHAVSDVAQHLSEQAQTAALVAELPAWEAILSEGSALIPGTVLDPCRDTYARAEHLQQSLSVEVTTALLTDVAAAFHARINDVLLTALAVAVAAWRGERGESVDAPLLIDLEGHGREPMSGGIDLSRTVGWFTSVFPVKLELGPIDVAGALAADRELGEAFKQVKEALRAIPGRGLGYGLLRYLHPETGPRLAARSEPQIGFNYLGRFTEGGAGAWSATGEESGFGGGDLALPMMHLLEINARTADGPQGPRLTAVWSWAATHLKESEVRSLAQGWQRVLEALVRHVRQPGSGGHTPSDFPLVTLTQAQVDQLETCCVELEDVLPLSPLQEGLLFHTLYDDIGPDVYTVQIVLELEGPLDSSRLRAAAEALVGRHANLRASIHHEGLERPVQVIPRVVEVAWREVDLSTLKAEAQVQRREELLAADRAERFVLAAGPLLRWMLLTLGRDRYVLVLANHHILIDGWSMPVFFAELLALYG